MTEIQLVDGRYFHISYHRCSECPRTFCIGTYRD